MQETVFFFNITKFSPMFSCRHVLHLCLICLYNTFWVIFCIWCKFRNWIKVLFVVFFLYMCTQLYHHHLFKKKNPFLFNCLCTFVKINWPCISSPFLNSILLHLSIFYLLPILHSLGGYNFIISFEIKLWESCPTLFFCLRIHFGF